MLDLIDIFAVEFISAGNQLAGDGERAVRGD